MSVCKAGCPVKGSRSTLAMVSDAAANVEVAGMTPSAMSVKADGNNLIGPPLLNQALHLGVTLEERPFPPHHLRLELKNHLVRFCHLHSLPTSAAQHLEADVQRLCQPVTDWDVLLAVDL